jgi:hypothetical protein
VENRQLLAVARQLSARLSHAKTPLFPQSKGVAFKKLYASLSYAGNERW